MSPLPLDIQTRIDAQLATGAFASHEDVLREAIETLERKQRGLQQLRELINVAEADVIAGSIDVFDRDDIKRDVRSRLAQRGITE